MIIVKKILICVWCTWLLLTTAYAQKTCVIFDLSSLIKQDTDARKNTLIKKLEESYHKKISTLGLWHIIRRVFDVPFFGNEQQVRVEFFKFLEGIKLDEQYPAISFEGLALPPIMVAWNLGRIDSNRALQLTNTYIDTQNCPETDKIFYHALVYITFDSAINQSTRVVNQKTVHLLDKCRAQNCQTYLVGHCDRSIAAWLHKAQAPLLEKFNKIVFSNQVEQLPEKTFDDAWWLKELGLTSIAAGSDDYVYICDWRPDGVKGDAPPHYACTSKALKKLLA